MYRRMIMIVGVALSVLMLTNMASAARCVEKIKANGMIKTRCVSHRHRSWNHCGRRCRRHARRWDRHHRLYHNTIRIHW